MVALAILVDVLDLHGLARQRLHPTKRFPDRARVRATAADVVDLASARLRDEGVDEPRHVVRMNIVAHLLALVPEHAIAPFRQIGLDEITEEAVELHARVIGPRQAAATEATGPQTEVARVFLNHDVRRDLRRAEDRVFRAVDPHVFANPVVVLKPGVFPPRFQFPQGQLVGSVAVDLVSRHEDERGLGCEPAGRLEEIKCAHGIDVKIVERTTGREVVTRLGGGMNDG